MPVRAASDPDPSLGFRYAVEVGGIVAGWFTRCAGLSVERSLLAHEEGGVNAYVHQLPGRITRTRITLERGIAGPALWRWFTGQQDEGLYEGRVAYRDVTVILYNADLTEARRWHLPVALPVRWAGPNMEAGSEQVAIETLELAQSDGGGDGAVQRAMAEPGLGDEEPLRSRAEVDLRALAERVYDLLKQGLLVERERRGWHR